MVTATHLTDDTNARPKKAISENMNSMPQHPHNATNLKCNGPCCRGAPKRETLARVGGTMLQVQDRRHGTKHSLTLNLTEIVNMLDPAGTTAVLVDG